MIADDKVDHDDKGDLDGGVVEESEGGDDDGQGGASWT